MKSLVDKKIGVNLISGGKKWRVVVVTGQVSRAHDSQEMWEEKIKTTKVTQIIPPSIDIFCCIPTAASTDIVG